VTPPVPGYPEGERANGQPGAQQRGAVWGFVPVDDAIDQVGVGWGRRLDGELVGAAREVSLAHLRVLEEVDHVGGVPPQFRLGYGPQLLPEVRPGSLAELTVPRWFRSPQPGGDRLLQCLVQPETVGGGVDDREPPERVHRLPRVDVGQHGCHQRPADSPHDGCGLKRRWATSSRSSR
jgi:hypothetical protein